MSGVTVRKRNKVYEWRFEGARVAGKRQQFSKSGFRTQKAAFEDGNKAYSQYMNTGAVARPSDISFADYLDEWMDLYVVANLRYNSQLLYRSIVDNYLKPSFGKYHLAGISPAALQAWANKLKLKGLAQSTLVSITAVMRQSLDYAVEPLRYIQVNPMIHIKTPKSNRPRQQRALVSPDDWSKVIERFPVGDRFHVMLQIGRYTGLRVAEVAGLQWKDIDLDNRILTVKRQLQRRRWTGEEKRHPPEWCYGETKTQSSVRTIRIGPTLAKILADEKLRQEKNEARYGAFYTVYIKDMVKDEKGKDTMMLRGIVKSRDPKGERVWPVCLEENGLLVTTDTYKYCANVIHKKLGITSFTFHGLRHTLATTMLEEGANIKAVQGHLGHTSISTTLGTYAHSTSVLEDRAVDLLEKRYSLPTAEINGGQEVGKNDVKPQ